MPIRSVPTRKAEDSTEKLAPGLVELPVGCGSETVTRLKVKARTITPAPTSRFETITKTWPARRTADEAAGGWPAVPRPGCAACMLSTLPPLLLRGKPLYPFHAEKRPA